MYDQRYISHPNLDYKILTSVSGFLSWFGSNVLQKTILSIM